MLIFVGLVLLLLVFRGAREWPQFCRRKSAAPRGFSSYAVIAAPAVLGTVTLAAMLCGLHPFLCIGALIEIGVLSSIASVPAYWVCAFVARRARPRKDWVCALVTSVIVILAVTGICMWALSGERLFQLFVGKPIPQAVTVVRGKLVSKSTLPGHTVVFCLEIAPDSVEDVLALWSFERVRNVNPQGDNRMAPLAPP